MLEKFKPSANLRNSLRKDWIVEAVPNARSLGLNFGAKVACGTSDIFESFESKSS